MTVRDFVCLASKSDEDVTFTIKKDGRVIYVSNINNIPEKFMEEVIIEIFISYEADVTITL